LADFQEGLCSMSDDDDDGDDSVIIGRQRPGKNIAAAKNTKQE
jgi:hypothetical protein